MEGKSVQQWIEKLLPMLNGDNTLEYLTEGLPGAYQQRIYDIANALYVNGYVRDFSEDPVHSLPKAVQRKFAPQIEFLDNLVGSGASRFENYRLTKVLAVGAGEMLESLVSSLYTSGLPHIHVMITHELPTNRERLDQLAAAARVDDAQVSLVERPVPQGMKTNVCREAVKLYDAVLYASQLGDVKDLLWWESICKDEHKLFLPALFAKQVGLAGPLVYPDSSVSWASIWRRIHDTAVKDPVVLSGEYSSTAGAILTNILCFELLKCVAGVTQSTEDHHFYLLNMETMEGEWHDCLSHPLVAGKTEMKLISKLDTQLGSGVTRSSSELLPYFGHLTDSVCGIFHTWDEGDLIQLPLSQCRVQVVNPISEGPADRLPEVICAGFTHEEARREAGLIGIEDYARQLLPQLLPKTPSDAELTDTTSSRYIAAQEFVGVGAGGTVAEAIWRGLRQSLTHRMVTHLESQPKTVTPAVFGVMEDEKSTFYLEAMRTLNVAHVIGVGESLLGVPTIWVRANGRSYGCVGLNHTMALQSVLQQALINITAQSSHQQPWENDIRKRSDYVIETSNLKWTEDPPVVLSTKAMDEIATSDIDSALDGLRELGYDVLIADLAVEPFLTEVLAGVFGVVLRQGESQ